MVEPLGDYFERLKLNYRDYPKIVPVKVAVHASEKRCRMFRVDSKYLAAVPVHAAGTGSVLAGYHSAAHRIPAEYIVQEEVDCVTLMELLETHRIRALDLLQIDAEGYDAEIVRMIDFAAIRPALIKYEHLHLAARDAADVKRILTDNGYRLIREKMDTIAVLRS